MGQPATQFQSELKGQPAIHRHLKLKGQLSIQHQTSERDSRRFSSSPYYTLQRQNAENLKQIFPEKEYRGLSPNFHIHVSVSELYNPTMGLPVLLEDVD
jgi:hypothetical protein